MNIEKDNKTKSKELGSALTKIILENKDRFFDFLNILENPDKGNGVSKKKTGTEKIIYDTSMKLIKENVLSLEEIEEIIKYNNSLSRQGENINHLNLGVKVCKKAGIDIKKVLSVCMDISFNIPTVKDKNKKRIASDKRNIVFNENALEQLKQLMGKGNFKEAMSGDGGFEIIQEMDISGNTYQRMRILFFLFDYHLDKNDIHIRPLNILQEISEKCGEDRTMENVYIIANFLSYIINKSLERNNIPNIESLDTLCSPENIIYFANENKNDISEFIHMIKMFHARGIIKTNINDYTVRYEGMLKNLEVKNDNITDLLDKSEKQELRPWESVILKVATTKVGFLLEGADLDIKTPENIKQYDDNYLFENKNQLLKDIFSFSYEAIINGDMQDQQLLHFLETSLPRSLGQILFFINFLERFIAQEKQGDSGLMQYIKKDIAKFWFHIYNRPFELQKNFYSISIFLLQHDLNAYQSFIEDLSALSKQNRKHFVEKIVPLIEPQLMIVNDLRIENNDTAKNEDNSAKAKGIEIVSISNFIESFFEKIANGTSIQELEKEMNNDENIKTYKKTFMEKGLGIKSPEAYLKEYPEITEYLFKYACNLSQKNEKNLLSIGVMLSALKTDSRNDFRINKAISTSEFTDKGNEIIKETITPQENDYRKSILDYETWLALQEDVSYTTTILPQTLGEKIFNIQQSFEDLYDPDIYEDTEVKLLAESVFQKKDKQKILKHNEKTIGEQGEFFKKHMPIINFTNNIEALNLAELLKTLKHHEEQGIPIGEELEESGKRALYDAVAIFKDIVTAYKDNSIPDTAQIRIEEIANNFSLEVDELTRIISPTNEFQGPIKIKSRITNDIIEIIKNIRGCLGCMQKNSNNHTNLQFMSPNRFIIFSGKEDEVGSNIADQICILSQTDQGLCFIMDGLYGARMSNILFNHCMTVIEKIRSIKDQQIKIFIPKSSIKSAGTNVTHFQSILNKEILDKNLNIHMEYTNIKIDTEHLGYQELGLKEGCGEGLILNLE